MKRKICFLGHFTAGGTEKATFMIANELVNYYDVFLISTHENSPFFKLHKNLKLDYLGGKNLIHKIIKFIKYLKENKVDVVVCVEAMAGLYAVPATKLAGCKLIVWEHANYFQTQNSNKIQFIRQIELRVSDYYLVLTKRDLKNFRQNFKIKCKIDYVYNMINLNSLDDFMYNINSKTILSVGILRDIKNFLIIPEIGKKIFNLHPDWVWKIYGKNVGDYKDKLNALIIKYNLENNIIVCGRTEDMISVYKDASIYVMTSKMEGLPMVLLEAKSFKLPLISFDIETGPDEIIKNKINGYLIKPYDIDKMTSCLCNLIENPRLRIEFSQKSIIDLDKFDSKVIVEKWIQILNSII